MSEDVVHQGDRHPEQKPFGGVSMFGSGSAGISNALKNHIQAEAAKNRGKSGNLFEDDEDDDDPEELFKSPSIQKNTSIDQPKLPVLPKPTLSEDANKSYSLFDDESSDEDDVDVLFGSSTIKQNVSATYRQNPR